MIFVWRRPKKKDFSSYCEGMISFLILMSHPTYAAYAFTMSQITSRSRGYFVHVYIVYYSSDMVKEIVSLVFHLSFTPLNFLRVLDLSQIDLGLTFTSEVEVLRLLRYLAIFGAMNYIPSSIANLSNLETFIVEATGVVALPDTIWKMKKLRHLESEADHVPGFSLPNDNLDDSAEQCNLITFTNVILSWKDMETVLRKFSNIRKLKCKISGFEHSPGESIKIPDSLSQLESLSPLLSDTHYHIEFCLPQHLRKLTLSAFFMPWDKISATAYLPNLEVLKLLELAFLGETWNMEEGQFPRLSFLKLSHLDIIKWTASDSEDHLPCLEKLVADNCDELVEVPSCLGDSSTLEMIEVFGCPDSAATIKQIQQGQESMGNLDFKVIISSGVFNH